MLLHHAFFTPHHHATPKDIGTIQRYQHENPSSGLELEPIDSLPHYKLNLLLEMLENCSFRGC